MAQSLTMQAAASIVANAINVGTPLSFFVGAGVSKDDPSFLPDWTEFRNAMLTVLTDRLYATAFLTGDSTTVVKNDLLEYDSRYGSPRGLWLKPEVVLQWIHSYIPTAVHNMLRVFACGHPNRNHLTLALLAARSNILLATCNFDTQIERAIETIGFPFRRFAGSRPAGGCHSFREYMAFTRRTRKSPIAVLKIHGCISAPSTIRATIEQVSRPIRRAEKEALRHLLRNRFLIVAGYSGRDPDIRNEFEAVAAKSKGLLWLARDEGSLTTEVSRIPNTTFGTGDINTFFAALADCLKLEIRVKTGLPISVSAHAETAVRNAPVLPTALALSELAMHIGCRSTVEILAERVITSSRNRRWIALAWMSLGDSKRRANPRDALHCFEQAEAAARTLRADHPLMYGHSLKYLAAQHYVLGDLDIALALNTKSLTWVRKSGDQATEGRVLDDRAIIYRQRGNIHYAIRLRMQSVALLEKAGDTISLAMVYNNLGKDYDRLDNFSEAEKWWRKSLVLKEKETSDSPDIGRTCFNIGELLRHTERREEALPFLTRARARARMHDDRVIEARALYSMAAIAFTRGKVAQAKRLVNLAAAKAGSAEDWHGHPARVKWAQEIQDMVTGGKNALANEGRTISWNTTARPRRAHRGS